MAASIEQKLDYLLKKIGYVASKTGIAEDSSLSGTKKAPFGESIPSPLVTPSTSIWAESFNIPATPPGSDTSFVKVYLAGSSGHRLTVDNTVSNNRTFIARSTYNNNSSAILGDWIDTSFSSDYIIKVFKGDPNSGGVQLSAAGSGSNDTWFFDYSSGVLNFNGTSVPSGVTSSNIYIVGYRYIGIKGVAVPGAGATFTFATIGDLNVTGVSTFFDTTNNTLGNQNTGSVQLDGGMGIAKNLTVKQNLHVGGYAEFVGVATFKGGTINLGDADTDDINVGGEFVSDLVPDVDDTYSLGTASKQWKNLFINGHTELDNVSISGVSTFSSPLDINTDVDIDGHTELDNVNIVGVTTFQSNAFFGDADYIQMGDSQDLKIGHVGSYSVILDQGEGNLSIGGDGFVDIMNTALDEYKARFTTNGSVELYFDNVNKFETTGYGATVFGTLQSQQLNVTGVSTYAGDADFNGHVDIDGHTELDNVNISGIVTTFDLDVDGQTQLDHLNVAGVSTYVGDADFNGHIDVDGHTELDNVNISGIVTTFDLDVDGHTNLDNVSVSGVTTTSGLLDINAGGRADTFIVEDLTDNRVVISGTGGELEDDANLTFNGSTLSVGVDLDVDGHTNLDNVSIAGVTTFTGTVTASGSLNLSGDLDVDGHSNLDNVSVAGVTTFTGAIDANGDLDIDGHTNLDNVDIAGVTTTSGLLDINAGGQANTFKVEDLTDNRVVIAGTGGELEDDANLTFNGSTLSVGVDLDVDGHTELDNVNISGVTTVAGNIDANGDLDVDGHTNLDNLSVSGVSTFAGNVDLNAALDVSGNITGTGDFTLTDTDTGSAAGPELKLFRNSASPADADYLGQIKFAGESDTGVERNYAKITGKILDASNGTEDGIIEFAHIKAGSQNISARFRSDSLQLLNGTNFSVAGDSTFTGAIDANGDLDVDGTTELDVLNVAETATFSSNIDANGDLDVDGHTELDNVNISGIATATAFHTGAEGSAIRVTSNTISGPAEMFIDPAGVGDNTGALRIKGDLFVDGTQTVINSTTIELGDFIVGIATTATTDSLADGAGIKIGPDNTFLYDHSNTSLKSSENLNLASGKTYKINGTDVLSATTLGSGVVNSSLTSLGTLLGLTVSGQTTLNTLGVTGVSTFTGAIDANGDLDVDGHTNLDNVSVAGVTTTSGLLDINAGGRANTFKVEDLTDNRVVLAGTGGELEDDANLTFNGSTLTVGVGLDVDGHTELDNVNISGVTTFTGTLTASGGLNLSGDLDVDGHTNLDNVSVAGVTTTSGLLDINAGGRSNTFIVEDLTDNRVVLAGTGGELEDDANLTFNGSTLTVGVDLDVDGHTNLDNVSIAGVTTATGNIIANGNIDLAGDIDVDGHTNLDNVSIAGVSTFTGNIDANGLIEATAGENKIPSLYANLAALPSASTYHGMFAHVHSTGRAYFAHAGNWLELVNKNVAGNVGTGTEGYNVGIITATGIDLNGDLDVDGHTNLDNVSVAGVTTFASRIVGAATNNVIPFLYSNYGDLPDAGTYHGAFAHVHSMGKGLFAHGGAWYELVNKELNGTVGTGTERYNVGQIDATDVDVSGITTSVSLHVGVGGTVITASGIGSVGINSTTPAYALDVVGDINSSTDIKVNGVSIVSSSSGASLDDVVALAIALG